MNSFRVFMKKHRVLVIIVIVLLVASLLISYALLGTSSSVSEEEQLRAQAAALEEYLADYDENGDYDYSTLISYADSFYTLGGMYYQLADDENSQINYQAAVPLYIKAVDLAPEDLNDLGFAQLYAAAAKASYMAQEVDSASDYYLEAVDLAPEDWEIARDYAYYLVGTNQSATAIDYLNYYLNNYATDENSSEVEGTIQLFQALLSLDEEEGNTDTTDDGSTDDDTTDDGSEDNSTDNSDNAGGDTADPNNTDVPSDGSGTDENGGEGVSE